VNKYQVRKCD